MQALVELAALQQHLVSIAADPTAASGTNPSTLRDVLGAHSSVVRFVADRDGSRAAAAASKLIGATSSSSSLGASPPPPPSAAGGRWASRSDGGAGDDGRDPRRGGGSLVFQERPSTRRDVMPTGGWTLECWVRRRAGPREEAYVKARPASATAARTGGGAGAGAGAGASAVDTAQSRKDKARAIALAVPAFRPARRHEHMSKARVEKGRRMMPPLVLAWGGGMQVLLESGGGTHAPFNVGLRIPNDEAMRQYQSQMEEEARRSRHEERGGSMRHMFGRRRSTRREAPRFDFGGAWREVPFNYAAPAGEWVHLTVSAMRNKIMLSVNGTSIDVLALPGDAPMPGGGLGTPRATEDGNGASSRDTVALCMDADVHEVRLWRRPRTRMEMARDWRHVLDGPRLAVMANSMLVRLPLSEGAGAFTADATGHMQGVQLSGPDVSWCSVDKLPTEQPPSKPSTTSQVHSGSGLVGVLLGCGSALTLVLLVCVASGVAGAGKV